MDNYTQPATADLYKVSVICEKTGLSRSKVYQLIQSGALPSVKIDGSRRIRRTDFETWIESLKRMGT